MNASEMEAVSCGRVCFQRGFRVYGVVDMGFSHRDNNVEFEGTEDLGNGLKALFTLEAGFAADTGERKQNGRLFGRQAFVGLSGRFGTLLAGCLDMPFHFLLSDLDPFHRKTSSGLKPRP
ncbi:MAG: porin [Zoogloeaceae bacterium]|nr:porin [Zoogloeaceae bacterium]